MTAGPTRRAIALALRFMIRRGRLSVRFADGGTMVLEQAPGPAGAMAFRDAAAERHFLWNPGVALGELYMSGGIVPGPGGIHALLDVLMLNLDHRGNVIEAVRRRLRQPLRLLRQVNPAWRARRNVAHHYDLDGRLYEQFLDAERFYSCAYFPTGDETIEAAQAAKVRHIAAKLCLDRPGLEVLDIGSGWGGLAIALARDHGARVTGITLSTEQLAHARARAAEAGVADRVRFELLDYRELGQALGNRPVDRVVSVGMFEHVGIGHYRRFFQAVRDALRPDGVALVHAIGRAHGPGATNPWLLKYIFPGGYSPALSEVLPAVERSRLWVTDLEVLRLHYALTLRHWQARFAERRAAIASVYDERFCRMFEYYLAASELTFVHGDHMVWQLQLGRRADAVPLTRDYLAGR